MLIRRARSSDPSTVHNIIIITVQIKLIYIIQCIRAYVHYKNVLISICSESNSRRLTRTRWLRRWLNNDKLIDGNRLAISRGRLFYYRKERGTAGERCSWACVKLEYNEHTHTHTSIIIYILKREIII